MQGRRARPPPPGESKALVQAGSPSSARLSTPILATIRLRGERTVRVSDPWQRSRIAVNDLKSRDFVEADDPIALFKLWLEEAAATEINDPEAMTLSTVDEDGLPDARMVLCKGADARGIVFYTNAESAKGRELAARPKAAALFHWKSLRRQARFRGSVTEGHRRRSRRLFRVAPRGSRLGAWASQQSRPLNCGRRWRRRSRLMPANSGTAKFRGPPIGGGIGSRRSRSNSGATAPFACTIASCSGEQRPACRGERNVSIRDLERRRTSGR